MKLLASLLVSVSILGWMNSAEACTDFRLMATDGTVLVTRSMEFAADLQGNILTQTRQKLFTTVAPDGKPGLSWKSKFGYIYIDSLHSGRVTDGMNEKGLSFEALYLPGEAQYQTVPAGNDTLALPYLFLGDWILGNFQTVDEVRNALPGVYVFPQTDPVSGAMIFPLHFSIYDASGKGIVVEYTSDGLRIYDNKVGILTNSPTYDWHIVNLKNYVYLSPYAPAPITIGNMTFSSMGQGAGSIGLPGDISPPSRFVKVAFLKGTAVPGPDVNGTVNLAAHIIDNVDIPLGSVRARNAHGPDAMEFTQWVVMKDLTHHVFYYRGYWNLDLRSIAVDRLDFSPGAAQLKMPVNSPAAIQDVTTQYLGQKSG